MFELRNQKVDIGITCYGSQIITAFREFRIGDHAKT